MKYSMCLHHGRIHIDLNNKPLLYHFSVSENSVCVFLLFFPYIYNLVARIVKGVCVGAVRSERAYKIMETHYFKNSVYQA